MADRPACHLFKQTRINLDWAEKRSTAIIDVPLPHHAGRTSRSLNIRKKNRRQEHPDTEEKFRIAHHASTASIYYRPADRFPRSILWRVVEDSYVLSVATVDFTRPESHAELETTFRFYFPEPIQPGTVGFADAPNRDELVIYVLTRDGVLYTLDLTPEFLLRNSFLRRGSQSSDYCTTYCPSTFTLHSPHFLLPISNLSLIVPLQDGNILKLDRNHRSITQSSDPTIADYTEKTFSDSGYFGFLKNKMPWVGAGTIQYGHSSVTHTTVVSAVAYNPTTNRQDAKPLLFTVSVDHSLKVWSLDQGTLIRATDLLNEPQSAQVKMKTWLDPSPSHLLAIIDKSFQPDHSFYLVSFSSAATGKFKFWAVSKYTDEGDHLEGQFKNLVDLYPEDTFNARPPSVTAPWIIAEFRITPASTDGSTIFDLWVLWKSDTNFQVQNVRFDISDVRNTWGQWTTATSDSLHNPPRLATYSETSEDVSEHWMKWIFYPGRFPDTVLESALRIYENNFLVPSVANPTSEAVQARIIKIVGAAVQIERNGEDEQLKYRNELDLQWDRFSRLCIELDKQRREALSLVSDPLSGFVWTVNVDGITALRECTETEVIWHNLPTYKYNLETLSSRTAKRLGAGLKGSELSDVMTLVSIANELGESLTESAFDACMMRLQQEVTLDPMLAVLDRMWEIYEKYLEQEVPQETYDKIEECFVIMHEPELAFQSLMSSLYNQPDSHSEQSRLTSFGAKVLVGGSQEVIQLNYHILSQLVLLLVYVACADESQRFSRLSSPDGLYSRLLGYLKEYEVLSWMARTPAQLALPSAASPADDISQALTDLRVSGESTAVRHGKRGSVLQSVLPTNFGQSLYGPGRQASVSLSLCIRRFLASLDLFDHGNGITNVAAALIKNNAGPAAEFAKFLPSTAWGTYMKARTQLKVRSFAMAAATFKRAAYGMSIAPRSAYSAADVFSAESGAVGCGLAHYHLHVATLFEEEGASEHVVDACNAALLGFGEMDDVQLTSEILLRYFRAALQVSKFDEAYLALAQYTDEALRHVAVRDLVTAMVSQDKGERLCSYPWIGLQEEVDDALKYNCQQVLDVSTGPPFHQVLYAWRIQKGDYRGAAYILYERLQRLRTANVGSTDPNSRVVADGYLALINVLSCVSEDQAWILSETRVDADGVSSGRKRARLEGPRSTHKREVLTLADIKTEYQMEVERVGLLLNGGFFV